MAPERYEVSTMVLPGKADLEVFQVSVTEAAEIVDTSGRPVVAVSIDDAVRRLDVAPEILRNLIFQDTKGNVAAHLSGTQAATILGIGRQTLRKRIRLGAIRAYRCGASWTVILPVRDTTESDASDGTNEAELDNTLCATSEAGTE